MDGRKLKDYKVFSVSDLIDANLKVEIGKQSKVCLELST